MSALAASIRASRRIVRPALLVALLAAALTLSIAALSDLIFNGLDLLALAAWAALILRGAL